MVQKIGEAWTEAVERIEQQDFHGGQGLVGVVEPGAPAWVQRRLSRVM